MCGYYTLYKPRTTTDMFVEVVSYQLSRSWISLSGLFAVAPSVPSLTS